MQRQTFQHFAGGELEIGNREVIGLLVRPGFKIAHVFALGLGNRVGTGLTSGQKADSLSLNVGCYSEDGWVGKAMPGTEDEADRSP